MSKTSKFRYRLIKTSNQRYDEKIRYASKAFKPFAGCERNNATYFESSVELPKTTSLEMIRMF